MAVAITIIILTLAVNMAVTLFHKVVNKNITNVVINIRNKPKPQNYKLNVLTKSEYNRDVKKV